MNPNQKVAKADHILLAQLNEWYSLRQRLAVTKAAEATLRKEIAEAIFIKEATGAFAEGTQHALMDINGKTGQVSLEQKFDYKVDEEKVKSVSELLGHYAATILKTKHEVKVRDYKALPENIKVIAGQMVTVKPASISLEIAVV